LLESSENEKRKKAEPNSLCLILDAMGASRENGV